MTFHNWAGTDQADTKTAHRTFDQGIFPTWVPWYMFGDAGNDTLTGGKLGDTLNGGNGADIMTGRKGNDTYIVDHINDRVVESAGEGTDTVVSSISYTLGANLENLSLTGNFHISGSGNSLDNRISGNSRNNRLNGLAGDDRLSGGGGRDTLNGGTGRDTMLGGTGNDIYIVDNLMDDVVEYADYRYGNVWIRQGLDTVETYVSGYTLDNNVENLKIKGNALSASGNELGNVMTGSSRNNTIFGRGGNDLLMGGAGSDRLIGGEGGDRLIGIHGTNGYEVDRLGGGAGADDFQLYNVLYGTAQTYDHNSYAILEDFSAIEQDQISVLGSHTEYSLNKNLDFLGGPGKDTLIYRGSNLVGVVQNNTNVTFDSFDFTQA